MWGGTGGVTGLDLEEQEDLLRRYFRPAQVARLMQQQREVDRDYSTLKVRGGGGGVFEGRAGGGGGGGGERGGGEGARTSSQSRWVCERGGGGGRRIRSRERGGQGRRKGVQPGGADPRVCLVEGARGGCRGTLPTPTHHATTAYLM